MKFFSLSHEACLFGLCIGFFFGISLGVYIGRHSIEHNHQSLHGKTVRMFDHDFLIIGDGSIPADAQLTTLDWKMQVSWETVENMLKDQHK